MRVGKGSLRTAAWFSSLEGQVSKRGIQMSLTDSLWFITMRPMLQKTWFSSHWLFQFTLFAFLISKWIPHGQMINCTIIHHSTFLSYLCRSQCMEKALGMWADIINHSHALALLRCRYGQHFHYKLPFSRCLKLSWENSFSDGSWYRRCPPGSNVLKPDLRIYLAIVKTTEQIKLAVHLPQPIP